MKAHKLIIGGLVLLFIIGFVFSANAGGEDRVDVIIGIDGSAGLDVIREQQGEILKGFNLIDAVNAKIPERAYEALADSQSVRYIEENKPVYALGEEVPWGLDRVFGEEEYPFPTWEAFRGDDMAIAVLDTGIDKDHENLPEPVDGVTTEDDTAWWEDNNGHGTLVSGVAASLDNGLTVNGTEVVGVSPQVDLYAVKVLNEEGEGSYSSAIEGIEWAVEEDIPIINMSLGAPSGSDGLKEVCEEAYEEGHLLIAAAGNEGADDPDNVQYPAKYDSVMAISASDENDNLADFSSTGEEVELIAPGEYILSTYPGDGYTRADGTSLSAPYVSGIAALVWAQLTNLSNNQVRERLQEAAEDLNLNFNEQGYGLSRADKMLNIKLKGSEVVHIPKEEEENSYEYQAVIYDQYGDEVAKMETDWLLEDVKDSNEVNIEDNTLFIFEEAEEDEFDVIPASNNEELGIGKVEVTLRVESYFDLELDIKDLAGEEFSSQAQVIIIFVDTDGETEEKEVIDLGKVDFAGTDGRVAWVVGTKEEESDIYLSEFKPADINEIIVEVNGEESVVSGLNQN